MNITYGDVLLGFTYTASGLVASETAANVLRGTPEYQCDYHQYDKAGSYEITVSGLSADNYEISYQPGTLTVAKLADYTLSFDANTLLQSVNQPTPVLVTVAPQDSTAVVLVEYLVSESWTAVMPTTAGTYSVRASLTASDNLILPMPTTYLEGTLVIRKGSFIGDQDAPIEVIEKEDGTVEIGNLDDEQIASITDNGTMTLDLTGGGVAIGTQALAIPASLVDTMNESSTVERFTVKMNDAAITFDSSVLSALAGTLEDGSTITIQMEAVDPAELPVEQQEALSSISAQGEVVILNLKLVETQESGNTTEIHELGGSAVIQVAYEYSETEGMLLVAIYIDDEGNTTYLPVAYENGVVSIPTGHFSVYAITEIEKAACGHSWDEGIVTREPTTASTGLKTYSCLICHATKTEEIPRKETEGGDTPGGDDPSSEIVSYAVIGAAAENGKLHISAKYASVGQTVLITVTPNDGYTLETLTARDMQGNLLTLIRVRDTVCSFTMPASNVTVSATFAAAQTKETDVPAIHCLQDETCVFARFTDADTREWYHDGVHYCVENELMKGISATQFAPNASLSRAMVVTMLWRMEGEPIVNDTLSFFDVENAAWYTEAIRWAQANEIVMGYSDESFGPNDDVTREQLAAILYRYAQFKDIDTDVFMEDTNTLSYDDVFTISDWANSGMHFCIAVGVIKGNNGMLNPTDHATRAMAATMIQRFCEEVLKKSFA